MPPTRRPSASVGPLGAMSTASVPRFHRSTESHHALGGMSTMQPHSMLSLGASAKPQQKIVQVLVTRLKNKLPCNSGLSLDRVEGDNATQQAIEALVELSHDSLDMIAWALCELLERIPKHPDVPPTIDVLQSQLFILKVLSMTMASRWTHNPRGSNDGSALDSPILNSSTRKSRQTPSEHSSLNTTLLEPPPMEDNCAKYILSVMIVFLRPLKVDDVPLMLPTRSTDISFRDLESVDSVTLVNAAASSEGSTSPEPVLRTQPSSTSVRSSKMSINSTIHIPAANTAYEKTHMALVKSVLAVNRLITSYAGRIIFHISASNWNVVFSRLRHKIRMIANSSHEQPDSVDLQIMAHSVLDKYRLVQLLNDLSSLLVNMDRDAQLAVAVPLRAAIWNWIDLFPHEFNECIRTRGRMEGAPERFFDLLYSLNPSGHERVLWPTLANLNAITSDRISPDFSAYSSAHRNARKDIKFGEEVLKHAGTTSKLAEVSLACAVDTCQIAMYVSQGGEVPLRLISYDIAHQIKNDINLINGGKPFWDVAEEIDVALYASALVAIYRFLPLEDSLPIFSACVEPERSDAVKTCAVRACLTLLQEASRFPWQKPLDKLQETVAHRFRNVLKNSGLRRPEIDQYGNPKRAAARPKAKKVTVEPLSDREVLLLGILVVWRTKPTFFLSGTTEEQVDTWHTIASKLWEAPLDISVKVAIASCFRRVSELVFTSPPGDPATIPLVAVMKETLPVTLLSLASNLLAARLDLEAQRLWMAVSHQVLELFVRKTELEHVKEIQCAPTRIAAFALTEIAFLVSLTSSDSSVSHLAAKGLRMLSHAEHQPDAPVNEYITDEERSKRNPIYEQLGDPKVMVIGRLGHQKRIRKLVRLVTYSSGIHIAVWEECYWRWRAVSELMFDSLSVEKDANGNALGHMYTPGSVPQEIRFQWQNLTLFLAALSGACIQDNQNLTLLSNVIPMKYLPDKMRVMQNPTTLVDDFTTDLINQLMSPDAHVRDVVREALGSELNPRLYPKFLRTLDDSMQDLENRASSVMTENYNLFFDQFIAVLKLLAESTNVLPEHGLNIDVSSSMLSLVYFISRFPGLPSFRVKLKYCQLCESICSRTDTLTLRKDDDTRRSVLDMILEWIQPNFDRKGEGALATAELNLAILRAAVKLLDRLELKPLGVSDTADDSAHVVSRLFNKYSTALLCSIEACQPDRPISDSISDFGVKLRPSQRDAEVRELVITGLSHLVTANSESGFKACLPLAYDPDNRKRAIFAYVFARVISQGTKFDGENRSITESRHARLCELVRGSDLVLAITICDICPPPEVEMMISVLLNIFSTRASLLKLLKRMIDKEVAQTDSEASLFRSNSTCTRFLSAFARIHGYNYLRELVLPLIRIIDELPPGSGFEVDRNRIDEAQAIENQKTVEYVAERFLSIISSSINSIPPLFREVCAHIAKAVAAVWPESKFPAIGAFVFLRFISPAVVSPETVDIELPKGDPAVIRKGLMVTAKILQNLANNIFFGKELHMTVLNNFLQGNITNVTRFLSELHKNPGPVGDEEEDDWLGMTSDDTDMIVLHRFFDKHADKIGKELLSLSKPSDEGDASAINGKRAWDGLCALLVDLGAPMEIPRLSPLTSEVHDNYQDLMTRYMHRSTESVRDFFVETGSPEDDHAFFVFRLSKLDVEALDIELLMYHIFQMLTLPEYVNRTFELILDCTSFMSMSEVPVQWLKYCVELIPSDIRTRFYRTHVLNPNTLAQKYLRRLYNVCAGTAICHDVKAYTSVGELMDHVPREALLLLKYPVSLEEEPRDPFPDVKMKVSQMRHPIMLEVASTHLRVTSVKTQPISSSLGCRSTEILPLSDISDVYNVSTGNEPHEFIIRRRHGVTIYFSSPRREEIVKAIRSAKGKLKEAQAPMSERFSRFSNVPATLLHIGLLSVDINDEELRDAAYDLLGSVCTYLKYDKSPIIACKAGFIPGDPNTFVSQLSERLAEYSPQLTLDFIHEVSAAMTGMGESNASQRISCLQYMSPWIRNFAHFTNPASPLFERSGARLRDCVRTLSELSMQLPELTCSIQKFIWAEMNKLDSSVVDVILEELLRTATDGGIGTRRCEAVAHIVGCLSSINVRGRIYSKLRKALGKQAPRVTNNLTDHPSWTEITSLIRMALVVGTHSRQSSNNQLYVSEVVHLVTLVAGDGTTMVRKTVYGIMMNLVQSLYIARMEELAASRAEDPALIDLITDCMSPKTLKLFGLARDTPTSEYVSIDPANEKEALDLQGDLSRLLLRILEVTSGSTGLLNVWKARWMSLVTSTAFQVSPAVQTRSFSALGCLATSEVDDDFMYQILVAFRTALSKADESNTMAVVSMLRSMCQLVPALEMNSKYTPMLFWLGVALLQSSHIAFYVEATELLRITLELMDNQRVFENAFMVDVLLGYRSALQEVSSQLDEFLRISFERSFSFSMASIIFKGMRHTGLKDSAQAVLRTLLGVTVRSYESNLKVPNGFRDQICPEALGYFFALIPVSTSPAAYRRLLKDCNIDEAWFPDAGLPDMESDDSGSPKILPDFLGISDPQTALFTTSFVGTILATAQGDDAESEMLYGLLSELSRSYPETVSITYESMQDRIKDTFANASNASILRSVSSIFRVALQDNPRFSNNNAHETSSTLSASDDGTPQNRHTAALDDLEMQGLATPFQFLPPNRGHATKMINWIPSLVNLMII